MMLAVLAVAAFVWVGMTLEDRIGPALPPIDWSLTGDDVDVRFWYGPIQSFGTKGQAQRWVNVLGQIRPPDQIESAAFSLNRGPEKPLSLGGDLHRLAMEGDFNVELAWDEVASGENTFSVSATLRNGETAHREVVVRVENGNRWPLPYAIDFFEVESLQDVVHVVDGNWSLEADGVRTVQRYYDRVLALGDTTWRDYEAIVRLTIHSFTPPEPEPPTYDVTHFGVAMRWRGHHEDRFQPNRKWFPLGAQGEFLMKTAADRSRWRILFDQSEEKPHLYSPKFNTVRLGKPIFVRAQVETLPDGRTRYRFKQWEQGGLEPLEWDVEGLEADDYPSGALCLVPHNTDVTIHEVRVEPMGRSPVR